MADISMCLNEDCPLKEKCYRYTAPASDYQYYSDFKYVEGEGCDFFWEV